MKQVYIYNSWHNGDVLTNRCLIKALMNYDLDIALGSYRNRAYIVQDLPVKHIIAPWDETTPHSPCLSHLCPSGYLSCNTWCGTFPDIDCQGYHNWSTIVRTWNRYSEAYEIGVTLPYKETPMIDFEYPCRVRTRGRAVFVENGATRSGHSSFEFDMNKIGEYFPDFNFYCTDEPYCKLPNVINCLSKDLVTLSFISNTCEVIIGKGSGPFLCTYTEANRKKPRAVVGYNSHPFWVYRDNPLKNLNNEDELIDFLTEHYNIHWDVI